MATVEEKILDGIANNGSYTTRTAAEAKAAIRLRAEGDIKRIQIVGSTTTASGKSLQLFQCT